MSTRLAITILVTLIVNAVVFGIGAVAVLSIEHLAPYAYVLLPAVIVASFVISPFIAWEIAPMMRSRYLRRIAKRQRTLAAKQARHGV